MLDSNRKKYKTLRKLGTEVSCFNITTVLTKIKTETEPSKIHLEWNVKSFLWTEEQDRESHSGCWQFSILDLGNDFMRVYSNTLSSLFCFMYNLEYIFKQKEMLGDKQMADLDYCSNSVGPNFIPIMMNFEPINIYRASKTMYNLAP